MYSSLNILDKFVRNMYKCAWNILDETWLNDYEIQARLVKLSQNQNK